ncbi:MAG: hypothetical protein KF745_07105 [Phycisphaeraceae bacterium]|nr:hypothetical protein [Phycisphaeraceae bacterium]
MAVDRETARKRTIWARGGVLALLMAAAAVAAIPVRATLPQRAAASIDEPPVSPTVDHPLDVLTIVSVLEEMNPSPIAQADVVPPPTPEGEHPVVAAAPAADSKDWKYVGSIVGPRRSHAMIVVNGTQELVAEGNELGGIRLLSVAADHVMVDDGSGPRAIHLAKVERTWPDARTGRVPRPNPAAASTPGGSPPPRAQIPGYDTLPEEERERIEAFERDEARNRQNAATGAVAPPSRAAPSATDQSGTGSKRAVPVTPGAAGAGAKSGGSPH